jgi:carboxypeptidase Q
MTAQQDGGSYGEIGAIRRTGPSIASTKGALAILIRSIGTDHHRVAHTGVQNWVNGAQPIPAAALSVPDAEQLARVLERGKPVTLHLAIGAGMAGSGSSGNVIAEVPGRDPKAGIILVGGHLDSWDLGTGAIDDAAGLAIVTAAAKRIMAAGRPRRTIRIVWFGAEEPGGFGGEAYAKAHAGDRHVLVGESDSGADRAWRLELTAADTKAPITDKLALALAPLGITRGHDAAHGGTDVGPIAAAQGAPVIDLSQDVTRYFDIHHTADDTLDKIDPEQLRQNVAAWTAVLAIAAEDAEELAPVPPTPVK